MGRQQPLGVILAGGAGRRIGGEKATVELRGRPLISYPLEAMRAALGEVTVIAKPQTRLPPLEGVTVWLESTPAQHPLNGIIEALELAGGRPVVVCAVDLPFVAAELIEALAAADPAGTPAVIAASGGALEPLLGCYYAAAAPLLARAAARGGVPLREAVEALAPRRLEVTEERWLFNVNAPEDLLTAAAILDERERRPGGRRQR